MTGLADELLSMHAAPSAYHGAPVRLCTLRVSIFRRACLGMAAPVSIAHAERPGQHGAEPAELVAKKVFHQGARFMAC